MTDSGGQGLMQALPESLQKFNLNPVHQGDRGGVQDLMHSLPESLQQFDLHLYSTKVSDLG